MVEPACKDCCNRTENCHGACMSYLMFQLANDEKKKEERRMRLLDSFSYESKERCYRDKNHIHRSIYGLYVR